MTLLCVWNYSKYISGCFVSFNWFIWKGSSRIRCPILSHITVLRGWISWWGLLWVNECENTFQVIKCYIDLREVLGISYRVRGYLGTTSRLKSHIIEWRVGWWVPEGSSDVFEIILQLRWRTIQVPDTEFSALSSIKSLVKYALKLKEIL